MQWIIENQTLLLAVVGAATCSAAFASWWTKQKFAYQNQLLLQQLESDKQLAKSQIEQLTRTLAQAQSELDEYDEERDKAAFEVKQSHGKLMAALEKLRYFEAVKQERQHYADELSRLREEKASLETQLREQQARHEQVNQANQEKLQLLEQAETRLKQQFRAAGEPAV